MSLNKICGFVALLLVGGVAVAQQPADNASPPNPRVVLDQPDKTVTYASAADVTALIARAKSERKDDLPMVVGNILKLAPYTAFLEYREPSKKYHEPVGYHEKDAELVYVIEGSGTLVTGGKMTADRLGIDGGETRHISKGDFFVIPEKTPHLITHLDQTLVLMSIHLPRPVPTP